MNEFMSGKPGLNDFEMNIKKYDDLHEEVWGGDEGEYVLSIVCVQFIVLQVTDLPDVHLIGTLALDLQTFKHALKREASAWKTEFGTSLNSKGKGKLDKYVAYMDETLNKLGKKVEDLSDINQLMSVLSVLREKESVMEMKMIPIEESYQVRSLWTL